MDAGARQPWREEVRPPHGPQHRPLDAGEDPGDEQGGRGPEGQVPLRPRDLVQGAEGEASSWQVLVDRRQPERQHGLLPRLAAVEAADAVAQVVEEAVLGCWRHAIMVW